MAEEATETLLPLAEKHGVTIQTSGDLTPVLGSPALLLQMTMNLVHNAIVHNLPAHGTVRVDTACGPEGVVLTVENTGDELAPALVSTLTEPFQRGTGRLRSDDAGVGLGLAIVESITKAHDGMLTLTPGPPGACTSRCSCRSRHRRPVRRRPRCGATCRSGSDRRRGSRRRTSRRAVSPVPHDDWPRPAPLR